MRLRYSPEIKKLARQHYVVGGLTFEEIAELEDMPSARQLRRWRDEQDWDAMCPSLSAEQAIVKRINILAEKEDKTEKDFRELDFLCKKQCELNISRQPALGVVQKDGSIKPAVPNHSREPDETDEQPTRKKRKKPIKNDVSGITKEKLDELKDKLLYPHQQHWFDNLAHRIRFILKPRQIGATFYFSFEAFYDAIVNGRNKIFISASRDQAEIFKANIIALCREHFGVELSGSPLQLNNNGKITTLYFKSTNARTAQSASGDLYVDEVFWIPKFKELRKLAAAMATHEEYRTTYFSTPSVTSHEAYEFWNGTWYQKTMACNDPEFEVNVSHQHLQQGQICADGIWRQMLTVHDVVEQGFDKINIELLKREYSKDEFDNLFMGKFIDDAHSAFNLSQIIRCQGDKLKWADFNPDWERPYRMQPVVIGFDPARTIDKATVAVLSCPQNSADKFRLLETLDLSGNDFEAMAAEIQRLTQRYHVVHIGVDTTGLGIGVFEHIIKFYPNAMPIHYNPIIKNQLVQKAINVISQGRFEYDQHAAHIGASFMNIRKKVAGDQVTYATNRSASIGHADIAWAIMHAMYYEPLTGNTGSSKTRVYLDEAS